MRLNRNFFTLILLTLIAVFLIACSGEPNKVIYTAPISLNKAPEISNLNISGGSGDISLLFDLSDYENDTASVDLYYSKDNGDSFTLSQNVSNNENIIPGKKRSILWQSVFDITNEVSVILKLVPVDYEKEGVKIFSEPFTVNNLGELTYQKLRLSASTAIIPVNGILNFSSFYAYVVYSDNTEIRVDNIVWEIIAGGGTIADNKFYAPGVSETVTIKASYSEYGVVQSTELVVDVYNTLTGITLFPQEVNEVGGYYDLSLIKVTADYDDGTSKDVVPTLWNIKEGTGQISTFNGGFVYFSDQGNAQDAILTCTYTENQVTYTDDVVIHVTAGDTILGFIRNIKGNSTDIQVEYTLVNPVSVTDSVQFYYSTNGGLTYTRSINISGDLEYLDEGDHLLTWHSDMDIQSFQNNVKVKVVPVKMGLQQDHIPSELISVDNTPRTLISINLSTNYFVATYGVEFDLSSIVVTAIYSDAPNRIVDNVVWRKKSGVGVVDNKTYLADSLGSAILEVYYMENGVGKVKDVSVTVGRKLTNLTLSQNEYNLDIYHTLDLNNIVVSAHYDDEGVVETVNAPIWEIVGGPGVLNNNVFTAIMSGTTVLKASYSEGNIVQSDTLVIYISPVFQNIVINPAYAQMDRGDSIDLDLYTVTINFADGSSKRVTDVEWIIKSGPGTIDSDNVFTSSISSSTTVIQVNYIEGINQYSGETVIKINPLLLSLRVDSGPVSLHSSQVYDLNDLDIIAKYDDNSEKVVTDLTWELESGDGSVSGMNYAAENHSGSAYLKVTYSESPGGTNIVTNAGILFNILPALSTLTLNLNNYNLDIGNTKNLEDFIVTANYDDGSSKIVTEVSYSIFTGDGALNNNLFTAPLNSGISVVRILYTEAGITKSSDVNIAITPLLTSITLSPTEHTMNIGEGFGLAGVEVTAYYNGRSPQVVSDIEWIIVNGGGTLNGTTYTATVSGINTLEARYEEITSSGTVISKTALFEVMVNAVLDSISLNPTGINMAAEESFDLRNVSGTAHYSDGGTENITYDITWSMLSGSGLINGDDFVAPSTSGTTKLQGEYLGETAQFTIYTQHRLDAVTFSYDSVVLKVDQTFDFDNGINMMALFNDGSTFPLAVEDVKLEIVNGSGSWQTSGVYKAPSSITSNVASDYAVVKVTYTENGITQSNTFHITIKPELVSLNALATINMATSDHLDLNGVNVYANYDNGASVLVPDVDVVWSLNSGPGDITGNAGEQRYNNESGVEADAVIKAQYTDNSVTVSTNMIIRIRPTVVLLSITPDTIDVVQGADFDLSTLVVVASYDNSTTAIINISELDWNVTTGGGYITGNTYNNNVGAPEVQELTVEYTYEGVTVSSVLTVNVL